MNDGAVDDSRKGVKIENAKVQSSDNTLEGKSPIEANFQGGNEGWNDDDWHAPSDVEIQEDDESRVGKVIKVDENTSLATRGKFARVFVEIDLLKPLLANTGCVIGCIRFEYEGIQLVCFHCGCCGHRAKLCEDKEDPVEEQGNENGRV
ncbi:hypothetical protein GH714_039640 [Hevea brasiliensis]|uniref:CCHC-type domain-containing protein n=1 Tax=Hevea brasiliensis TaxID=3981 RepID=A0A6A6MJY4_HEVBR|nr:hypothetical protein GH714_039640 [Hevea brasiliensis]